MENETKIIMHDNAIRFKEPKNYLLAGFGFILILFGLISFGYKNGSHGISNTFTFGMLIIGVILILVDSARKKK